MAGVTSGQPGAGRMFFQRPGDKRPFFLAASMPNCHSLALRPDGKRLVVSATNANSAGNGRLVGKDRSYPGNTTPLFVWELGVAEQPAPLDFPRHAADRACPGAVRQPPEGGFVWRPFMMW